MTQPIHQTNASGRRPNGRRSASAEDSFPFMTIITTDVSVQRKLLVDWCRQVMRSRIEPTRNIARPLRRHRERILNDFRDQKLPSDAPAEIDPRILVTNVFQIDFRMKSASGPGVWLLGPKLKFWPLIRRT